MSSTPAAVLPALADQQSTRNPWIHLTETDSLSILVLKSGEFSIPHLWEDGFPDEAGGKKDEQR